MIWYGPKNTALDKMKEYKDWIEINKKVVMAHEQKEGKKWKDYISEGTKQMIEQKG